MELQETQTKEIENQVPSSESIPDYMNSEESREIEPITQVQRNNLINTKELPDFRLILGLTLILGSFLFVTAIYFGIINP